MAKMIEIKRLVKSKPRPASRIAGEDFPNFFHARLMKLRKIRMSKKTGQTIPHRGCCPTVARQLAGTIFHAGLLKPTARARVRRPTSISTAAGRKKCETPGSTRAPRSDAGSKPQSEIHHPQSYVPATSIFVILTRV